MSTAHFVVRMFSLAMMILGADVVSGQTTSTGSGQAYPNKPIRIVAQGIGTASDNVVRFIAPGISASFGQPVIVDNRGPLISAEVVSKATADGYTLLIAPSNIFYGPLLQKMAYDPVKDFAPITMVVGSVSILVVPATLPVKSVKELIALAKGKPGELNYASSGTGGGAHLMAELFKSMAGVNITRIAYKGTALALNDLISGQVHMVFNQPSEVMQHVNAGKLRALAVTTPRASALAPGLPPLAATLPGFEFVSQIAMLAPAGTPTPIINRLNQEIVRFLKTPEVQAKFLEAGQEVVGNSPEEVAAWVKTETARMGKVIKDAGIRVD